uniref:Uncharacterized protein n=1 Tax=Heliothis virescens TaxID=7102 RepID=A0A2A4J417_HELVI
MVSSNRGAHVLVWEQPGLEDQRPGKKSGGLGHRHFVTFMLFLGMANAYIMRTNMSVAIVAMVNHTALPVISEPTDTECGVLVGNETHVSTKLSYLDT